MRQSVLSSAVHSAQIALLNAPFTPGGWNRAIEAVAIATGSSAAQLIGVGGSTMLSLNIVEGEIVGNTAHINDPSLYGPCNWRINCVGAPMSIQHEGHYRAYAARHDTADYDDAVADVDLPFGCQSLMIMEERWAVGLALLRRHRDGPCDADVLNDFAYLRHHAARSVTMQAALDEQVADVALGDLARVHSAVVLLDRHGLLRAVSEMAQPLFEDGGPLRRSRQSVWLRDPDCNQAVQSAIARLLDADFIQGPIVHQTLIRAAPHERARWRLTLMRLPNIESGIGFNAHLAMTVSPMKDAVRETQDGGERGRLYG